MLDAEISRSIAAGAGSRRIRFVGIHTEGDGVDNETSAAEIRAWHRTPKPKGPGWRDIGYNFWVRMSGLIELGRPLAQIPAHIEGFNRESIGVGFAGDGNIADFTPMQYLSGLALVSALIDRFAPDGLRIEHVIGHREAPAFGAKPTSKLCPGLRVDMRSFRARLVAVRQYGPPPPPPPPAGTGATL